MRGTISVIDRSINAAVDRSLEWRRKETLLTSVPGVGPTIARTLIAELPELGSLNGKQVAALVGLALGRDNPVSGEGGASSQAAAHLFARRCSWGPWWPAVTTPR
jgi:transposase